MSAINASRCATAVITITLAGALFGSAGAVHAAPVPELFDTGQSEPQAVSAETLAGRQGWNKIPEGKKPGSFKGGAVIANDQAALVLRQGAPGIELYGAQAAKWKLRASLAPVGDGLEAAKLDGLKAVQNDGAAVAIEATFAGKSGKAVITFELGVGHPIAKTKAVSGAAGLRIEASARLGVLPDFFADDMVIDARAIPVDRTELPSENFFMQMLANGDSILTAIWDKSDRDVELTLSGQGEARTIAGVEVFYGAGGSIWVAVLEKKGIWGQADITPENVKKVITLDWKVPFQAKWKGNFMRVDHTVDSWEFSWNPTSRHGWSGVVGGYEHPCWIKGTNDATAFIQAATQFPNGNFAGPFVAYPIERSKETPIDRLTIADLMRNSLGIGPCEYVMDVAGQGVTNRGIYTCSVEHTLPPIYDFGQQKDERMFIEKMLVDVVVFVKAIQDRINSYVDFRADMLKYLEEQKKARADLAPFIGRLEEQTKRIQASKVDGVTPVSRMTAQLRQAAVEDVPKVNCSQIPGGIAGVGLGQDNTVARCRQAVKMLRQMATIEMAVNPKTADVAKEVRKRTQQILRSPFGHEMR